MSNLYIVVTSQRHSRLNFNVLSSVMCPLQLLSLKLISSKRYACCPKILSASEIILFLYYGSNTYPRKSSIQHGHWKSIAIHSIEKKILMYNLVNCYCYFKNACIFFTASLKCTYVIRCFENTVLHLKFCLKFI